MQRNIKCYWSPIWYVIVLHNRRILSVSCHHQLFSITNSFWNITVPWRVSPLISYRNTPARNQLHLEELVVVAAATAVALWSTYVHFLSAVKRFCLRACTKGTCAHTAMNVHLPALCAITLPSLEVTSLVTIKLNMLKRLTRTSYQRPLIRLQFRCMYSLVYTTLSVEIVRSN